MLLEHPALDITLIGCPVVSPRELNGVTALQISFILNYQLLDTYIRTDEFVQICI